MNLPTAPAKVTDRRSFGGVGDDPTATVQAEAIPPDVLAHDLEDAIRSELDLDCLSALQQVEAEERDRLVAAVSKIAV
jgi:hypothetical protein